MLARRSASLQLFPVLWISLRSLGVICYDRWLLSEGHKNYFKDWFLMNSRSTFLFFNLFKLNKFSVSTTVITLLDASFLITLYLLPQRLNKKLLKLSKATCDMIITYNCIFSSFYCKTFHKAVIKIYISPVAPLVVHFCLVRRCSLYFLQHCITFQTSLF